MNPLITDPSPAFLAIGFFFILSIAGIAVCSAYFLIKENSMIRNKIGNDKVEWILKQ